MPIPLILLFATLGGLAAKSAADQRRKRKHTPNPPPAGDVGFWPFDSAEWYAVAETFSPSSLSARKSTRWQGPRKLTNAQAQDWRASFLFQPQPADGWRSFALYVHRGGAWVRG